MICDQETVRANNEFWPNARVVVNSENAHIRRNIQTADHKHKQNALKHVCCVVIDGMDAQNSVQPIRL